MNYNENYLKGIKYFIYLISQNTDFPYIDTDIRKIIWNYALEPPYILCYIKNNIVLRLNININLNI